MEHVKIIAEAGVNHNGSLELAKKLIDVAKEAGADAIKFQTFCAESLSLKNAPKAQYQRINTKSDSSQYEMLKNLELSHEDFKILFDYCFEKKITFLSSPFDVESAEFLQDLGMEIFKIASSEITDRFVLKTIAAFQKPIILSTGMAEIEEIGEAITLLESNKDITLLHCTSDYPVDTREVNLKAMCSLQQIFQKKVGFSDHTMGYEVAIAATALGACVIEKHITLNATLPGPDQRASLEPEALKQFVTAIRYVEQALGDGRKKPTESELRNKEAVRKSLVTKKQIKRGEVFSEENLGAKRPGTGISPMRWESVIGTVATRDYRKDELIEE